MMPESGTKRPSVQAGFTLIELLLVLGILSALAVMTLDLVGEDNNQTRFELTKQRIDNIRKGVLGQAAEPFGELRASGFAADMGRLPRSLSELLQYPLCSAGEFSSQQACKAAGGDWFGWRYDETTGVWLGWRGPYVVGYRRDNNGVLQLRDGWGNHDVDAIQDRLNYGWRLGSDDRRLGLQSLGLDGVSDRQRRELSAGDLYSRDYPASKPATEAGQGAPALVVASDYLVDIDYLPLSIVGELSEQSFSAAAGGEVCALIYYPRDGRIVSQQSRPFALQTDVSSGVQAADIRLRFSEPVPWGQRSLVLVEAEQGRCSSRRVSALQSLSLQPRTTQSRVRVALSAEAAGIETAAR